MNLSAVSFHPNGRWLAVGHAKTGASVYDLNSGCRVLAPEVGQVTALAFHPIDSRLVIACGNTVKVFDTESGKEMPKLRPGESKAVVRCLAWHPNGRRVALGCDDGKVYLVDADSAALVMPAWVGHREFQMLAFNHAGDRLITSETGAEARLWDVATGRPLLTMPADLAPCPAFSADDQLVGFSRTGGKVQVWRLANGRELRMYGRTGAGPEELAGYRVLDPSGRVIAGSSPERLCFFDVVNGEELASVTRPRDSSWPFAFDPAGGWLISGVEGVMFWPMRPEPGEPDSLRIGPPQLVVSSNGVEESGGSGTGAWQTGGERGVTVWPPRADPPVSESPASEPSPVGPPRPDRPRHGTYNWMWAHASGDGRLLAIPDSNATILVDRDHPDHVRRLGPQLDVHDTDVSHDGRWVISSSGTFDGHSDGIRVWEGKTGDQVLDLPVRAPVNGKFTPDGRYLGTSDASGSSLWDVGTWTKVRSFQGDFIFSPDSQLIAVNDFVGCLRLVSTATGEEVARVEGPDPAVKYTPMCFSPDGTRLFAVKEMLYAWDLRAIRDQLSEMGLAKEWPSYSSVPNTQHRPLRLTIDLGISTPERVGASSSRPSEPASDPGRSNAHSQ